MKKKSFLLLVAVLLLAACGKTYEDRLRECDEVGEFHDGFALCKQGEEYFYIDQTGKKIAGDFWKAGNFENGYAVAWRRGSYGLVVVDKEGKSHQYPQVCHALEKVNKFGNLWVSTNDSQWVLLEVKTGSLKTCFVNDIKSEDEEGNVVTYGGGIGYMLFNGQGEELVEEGRFKYMGRIKCDRILFSFTEKSAAYDSGKYGYIDTKGNIVIPAVFPSSATEFNDRGYACWSMPSRTSPYDKEFQYFDKQGLVLTGKEYYVAEASFKEDGKWVFGVDEQGERFLVNNKGKITTLDVGSSLAVLRDFVVSKKGGTYKIYRTTPESFDLLFVLNGTGRNSEHLALNSDGNAIELINDRPVGGTYETFDLNGTSLGITPMIVEFKVNQSYKYRTFNFR